MKRYTDDFGKILSNIRRLEGETQQGLADKLKIPKPTVRGWEQAYSLPSADNWKKLKKRYGKSSLFPALETAYISSRNLSRV